LYVFRATISLSKEIFSLESLPNGTYKFRPSNVPLSNKYMAFCPGGIVPKDILKNQSSNFSGKTSVVINFVFRLIAY